MSTGRKYLVEFLPQAGTPTNGATRIVVSVDAHSFDDALRAAIEVVTLNNSTLCWRLVKCSEEP